LSDEVISTDEWLERVFAAGRTLVDVVVALDLLDDITIKKRSRPTIGFMCRNTTEIP
jgi:hypothetical protein